MSGLSQRLPIVGRPGEVDPLLLVSTTILLPDDCYSPFSVEGDLGEPSFSLSGRTRVEPDPLRVPGLAEVRGPIEVDVPPPVPGILPDHVDMPGRVGGQGGQTGARDLRLGDIESHLFRPRPAVVGRRHQVNAVLAIPVIRPGEIEVPLIIGRHLHGALDIPFGTFHAELLTPGPTKVVRGPEVDAASAIPGIEPDGIDMAPVVAADLGPSLHHPPTAHRIAAQLYILRKPGGAIIV